MKRHDSGVLRSKCDIIGKYLHVLFHEPYWLHIDFKCLNAIDLLIYCKESYKKEKYGITKKSKL